ncbi:MAG: murein biosynthesis integral membrane protein MurJ [Treponema sp.]|uniref:murein biosynthesis integral membrane protein MurJ n=1 Tax=Treponema sp. TaxID=166 RepID=UPI00298E00E3|nr:murein biosynthesis integral membrane protein MurJ [Treponema sp.]MBR5932769.1 murein biosynthesis integral membrane protein MurJ [Treponema sp.]
MDSIEKTEKLEKKEKNIVKSGIKLSFLTLLSRILGVIREAAKAHFLGTSGFADAFGVAFLIPNLLRRLFAENSISVAFIPTFRGYIEDNRDKKETQEFINSTFTLITFLTTLVVIIGTIITPLIVKIFYKDSSSDIIAETVILTRIMFPYLIVISIAALFQGLLNTLNIFSPSGFTPVLFNLCVIFGTIILQKKAGNPARAMAIGVTTGGIIQALFQLPFVIKNGWKINLTTLKKTFTNPGTKKVVSLIVPTIIGMATYQLNDLVSTALAGRTEVGVVSSLQYSLRLQELILGIFAVSIGTVILPDLTGLAKKKLWNEYNDMLTNAVKIIALVCVPITFYSLITGREIISLVFKSRAFNDDSVNLTLSVFIYHISALFFIAANRIISPAFYAQGNTKLPTLAGIISFIINIILAIVLTYFLKGPGIALALSLSSVVNTVLLFVFLKKIDVSGAGTIAAKSMFYCLKMVILSFIAAIPVYYTHPIFVKKFISLGRFLGNGIPLFLSFAFFASIGLILLLITKDEILFSIINKFLQKGKSK